MGNIFCPACKEEYSEDKFALLRLASYFRFPKNENKMKFEVCNMCASKIWAKMLTVLSNEISTIKEVSEEE